MLKRGFTSFLILKKQQKKTTEKKNKFQFFI